MNELKRREISKMTHECTSFETSIDEDNFCKAVIEFDDGAFGQKYTTMFEGEDLPNVPVVAMVLVAHK